MHDKNLLDMLHRYIGTEDVSLSEVARRVNLSRPALYRFLQGGNSRRVTRCKLLVFLEDYFKEKSKKR